jgi:UDP-glucose 4-epimerase
MKKILITGGAGFIGTNLIIELSKDVNLQITCLDCYFTGKKENHISGVEYIEGYTWDIEKIFVGREFDIIFHFGEYSRIVHSFNDINFVLESILRGTPKVFEFARKCSSKIIYSASSSKFGNNGEDENLSPYAWMKSKMVELLKNYGTWFNLKFEICYFFNVYGQRQIYEGNYATVVAIFERLYKENKKLTVVKPGTQSRDFTHIKDIVRGVLLTVEKNMNYEWHLRSGVNVSIIDLAEKFGEWEFIEERKGERFTSELFNSDTNKQLGWNPSESLDQWILNIKNQTNSIEN